MAISPIVHLRSPIGSGVFRVFAGVHEKSPVGVVTEAIMCCQYMGLYDLAQSIKLGTLALVIPPKPFASIDDLLLALKDLPEPDMEAAQATRRREPFLTKPPGSLGRLEDINQFLSAWQGRHPPRRRIDFRYRLCRKSRCHGTRGFRLPFRGHPPNGCQFRGRGGGNQSVGGHL